MFWVIDSILTPTCPHCHESARVRFLGKVVATTRELIGKVLREKTVATDAWECAVCETTWTTPKEAPVAADHRSTTLACAS